MKKNKIAAVIIVLYFISCKEKKAEQNTPSTDVVSSFTYTNQMMDCTLKKGKTYLAGRKEGYNRNDIVVFRYNDMFLQKPIRVAYRVVGMPGDTVEIKNAKVFVNGGPFLLPPTALYHYRVFFRALDDEMKAAFNVQGKNGESYDCFVSEKDSSLLSKKYSRYIISMKKCPLEYNFEILLNRQNRFGWDTDNFGPVVVPKVNSRVSMDTARIFLYEYAESEKTGELIITQPYYFVLGDNFDNATSDSRSIGMIGYSQIEGALKL
jgi:signal peptidase I